MPNSNPSSSVKPPLLWTGILFAFAVNMLFVTLTMTLVQRLGLGNNGMMLATLVAPVLAGIAASVYVKQRGGIHAFIGGFLSVPLLALIVFGGNWQAAIFAGAFCGLAGACMEIFLRSRTGGR